jgi:hypothetical protein
MKVATIDDIRRGGFVGEIAIAALQKSECRGVPKQPGVYLVLRPDAGPPNFLPEGTGGHLKGKDPNVEVGCLKNKWVEGAIVLYIGKTGPKTATLRSRLRQYMQFGQRKRVGHWGGRYIWQLRNSSDLLVCWKAIENLPPRNAERALIAQFRQAYDKPPFANIKS